MKKYLALLLTFVLLVCTLPVSFSASVIGISYTPVKTQFLFETDGEWRTDGGSDYFHYKLEHFVGDKFVMYLDGNREDHFTCVYNEEENQLQFVNDDDPWDTLSANEVSFYDEQEQEHWDKGENSYTVDWGGKRYTVSVTVVDNPVESIYYETVNPVVLLQDCEGEWKYDNDWMPYFCYKYDMVQAGDTLFVSYTDGAQTMFTAHYDGAADTFYFESETGERIEYGKLALYCYDNQQNESFNIDTDNYYYVSYSGRTYAVPVSVIPNEVESISYEPAQPRICAFEKDGHTATDKNGRDYFCYDYEQISEGDVLRVTNIFDETISYTAKWDADVLCFYFESENGEIIDANQLKIYDNQSEEQFSVGTNHYNVKYSGRECEVEVLVTDKALISGKVALPEDYKKDLEVHLIKGETTVQSITIQPEDNGCFVFNNLEQGEYSIVVCGDAIVPFTLSQISVNETEVLNLHKSENDEINTIQIAFGDVNGDSLVDLADISYVLQSGVYGSAQSGALDLDNNGTVDVGDIALILQSRNYGTHAKTLNLA